MENPFKVIPFLFVYLISIAWIISACQVADVNGDMRDISREAILPTEYAELENPIKDPQEFEISRGEELYQYNCAACHGDKGLGNGSLGMSLDSLPANLAIAVNESKNNYLFWRIARGGIQEPFNSAMPSWDALLTDQEIWEVVSYLHMLGE